MKESFMHGWSVTGFTRLHRSEKAAGLFKVDMPAVYWYFLMRVCIKTLSTSESRDLYNITSRTERCLQDIFARMVDSS